MRVIARATRPITHGEPASKNGKLSRRIKARTFRKGVLKMTQLTQPFNPMQHDPSQTGGGGFPVGKHPVVIKSAELKATTAGDGGLIEFQLEIIDGPARGTTGAYRLNLYNKSEKAAKIAASQLSALCHVTGQFQLGADGTQLGVLFGIPFVIDVGFQKLTPEQTERKNAGENVEPFTEVKKVYDIAGNEPGKAPANTGAAAGFQQTQQQAPPQQTQQQQPGGAQAWQAPQQGAGSQQGGAQPGNGWGGQPQTQQEQPQTQQGGWNAQQTQQTQPQGQPNNGQAQWSQGQQTQQGGPSWGAPK